MVKVAKNFVKSLSGKEITDNLVSEHLKKTEVPSGITGKDIRDMLESLAIAHLSLKGGAHAN